MADPFKPGRLVAINGGPWPDEIYINDTGINPAKWAKLTNEERTFIPVELRPAGWDHVPGDPEI